MMPTSMSGRRLIIALFLLISSFQSYDSFAQTTDTCRYYRSGDVDPLNDPGGQQYRFPPRTIDVFTGADLSETIAPAGYAYTGLVNRMVKCVQAILWNIRDSQLSDISDEIRNFVRAVLTLYLVFFFFRVMFLNLTSITGEVMVVVFTISGVIAMMSVDTLTLFTDFFEQSQEALIDNVISSVNVGGRCMGTVSEGITMAFPYDFNMWQRIDCTIARLFGILPAGIGVAWAPPNMIHVHPFGYDATGDNAADTMTLLFFVMGSIFATSFVSGIFVLLVGGGLIFLFVYAIAASVMIFLSSFMALIFLGLIAPVIIPTILFSATRNLFHNWLRYLFAYSLQPMILFAYIAFMMNIINLMIEPSDATPGSALTNFSDYIARGNSTPAIAASITVGGLESIYEKVKNDLDTNAPNVEYVNDIGVFNSDSNISGTKDPCDTLTGNPGNVCGGVYVKGYRFSNNEKVHERMVSGLVLYLVLVLLVVAVTFSFMVNVMEFGEKLVGIEVTSPVDVRIFERAQRKISAAIDNASKAAKIAAGAGK